MNEPIVHPVDSTFVRPQALPTRPGSADGSQTNNTGSAVDERRQIAAMKQRDREVRAHEQAHLSAAGAHATGGPSFSYQRGPDGRQYAVGGEVNIDVSPVPGDPRATLEKMEQIQRAALAPAQPSGQDRAVAAQAARQAAEARLELATERRGREETAHTPASEVLRDRLAAESVGVKRLGRYLSLTA